ncbi:hypothetical protein [Oscillatoria salina]|uniref:hypothetical protein n=1 Tax=Oscillatoria salina TaxID=331517 RepID=UPI0013BA012F|nr:hypothetical protein [Oscillatoria salina]MBZ8182677.1 hypothetical protein [Oscillatoria salina IIICB1]NET89823.1 hypothetical protein [Kamptonema sp. SIO1D9]
MNYWQKSSVTATIAAIAALTPANASTLKTNGTRINFTNKSVLQYRVTIGQQLTENEVQIYTDRRMFKFSNYP